MATPVGRTAEKSSDSKEVKEDNKTKEEAHELSLVDFCTQLDDYTPTVSEWTVFFRSQSPSCIIN